MKTLWSGILAAALLLPIAARADKGEREEKRGERMERQGERREKRGERVEKRGEHRENQKPAAATTAAPSGN